MRRVLCVFYYFPPSGGPGVQRGLKFIRYLPEFGWEPIVLTVRADAHFPVRDESLCDEIPPGLIVRRTRCPEFYGLYRLLSGQRGVAALDITTHSAGERRGPRRLLRWLRGTLFVPDGRAAWAPFAIPAGLEMIRGLDADLVFSSGPPFTCHLIGRALRRRTRRPWVADYRDPWTQATFYPTRPGFARRRDLALEAACIREADRSIVVGPAMAGEFRRRYPEIAPEKFDVIANGYDEADFAGVPYESPDRLQITHTGSVFASRSPQALLGALARLLADEPDLAARLRLTFAGRLDDALRQQLAVPPFDAVSEMPGYLPHAESIRLLRRSSLLLLLIGMDAQARSMLTGKLFEYLASGVPILALGPRDGDAARLLQETGAGWVLEPSESDAILARLREIWQVHRGREETGRDGDPAVPPQLGLVRRGDRIAAYSRRALTRRLAEVFDELAPRPAP